MSKRILVYGSLRNGEYNFQSFQRVFGNNIKYEKTLEIEGFSLYSLGPYPGINKSLNKNSKLTVDILNVNEVVYNQIKEMELGAGYKEEFVNIDGEQLPIYVYKYPLNKEYIVESGDWSSYLKSKRNEAVHNFNF